MTKLKMIIIGGWEVDECSSRIRWLYREHSGETISWIGPWLDRYVRYTFVQPPADMVPDIVRYGSYTTGVTMHVYTDYPPLLHEMWGMVGIPARPNQKSTQTPGQVYSRTAPPEPQRVDNVFCFAPFVPTDDFMGANLNPWSTSILRWFTATKYPKGISEEEGEDWFLNVHAKEVMQQPGLLRYFSYKTLDFSGVKMWNRITEQWYADYKSWHKAVVENPPKYTKPSWAKFDKYPFFEPHKDFLGTFILERPTHDLLKDDMHYVIGP